MMPIGPLMIEHRLIERMIQLMKHELVRLEREPKVNYQYLDTAVDFIRTYADRCHHGKEEDILFRDLRRLNLDSEHIRIMNELIEDHKLGRIITRQLIEAARKNREGDQESLGTIKECLSQLVNFYPKHIEKEDQHFFLPVMNYLTKQHQDEMLKEEYEFDRNFIHKLYREIVEGLERK